MQLPISICRGLLLTSSTEYCSRSSKMSENPADLGGGTLNISGKQLKLIVDVVQLLTVQEPQVDGASSSPPSTTATTTTDAAKKVSR